MKNISSALNTAGPKITRSPSEYLIWRTTFNYGSTLNTSSGMANIYIFEKWQFHERNQYDAGDVARFLVFPAEWRYRQGTGLVTMNRTKLPVRSPKHGKTSHCMPTRAIPGTRKPAQTTSKNSTPQHCLHLTKKLWPALEYNYVHVQGKGYSHDLIPGLIWKYRNGGAIKVGLPITVDATTTFQRRHWIHL